MNADPRGNNEKENTFFGINWKSVNDQIGNYGNAGPFDHVVINNVFTDEFANVLVDEFPALNSTVWHEYDNALD